MGIKNDAFSAMPEPKIRMPEYTDQAGNEIDIEAEFQKEREADDDDGGAETSPALDVISDDDWQALKATPEGRKARTALAQRLSALQRMESERGQFDQQFAALQAQVQSLSNNGNQGTKRPSDYSDASDAEIRTWIANAKTLRQRAAVEPDNAALQAEAAKISDTTIDALNDELVERKVERVMAERMAPLAAAAEASSLDNMIGRQLAAAGISTDALTNDNNPLRRAALNRATQVSKSLGVTNSDSKAKAVAVVLSMLMEHELSQERSRAGRGANGATRRQLDIEGASRRAAASASVGSRGGNAAANSEMAKLRQMASFVRQLS